MRFLFLLFFSSISFSQVPEEQILCMSLQTGKFAGSLGEIKNNIDAQNALNRILSVTGISQNFIIAPCEEINNATASAYKGKRYILYDKKFINSVNRRSNNWSSLFILAHEVGHHLNGHSLDILLYKDRNLDLPTLKQKRQQEIEADEFAAFILGKLGAKLYELEEIINKTTEDYDDQYSSHPNRINRQIAVRDGFNKSN